MAHAWSKTVMKCRLKFMAWHGCHHFYRLKPLALCFAQTRFCDFVSVRNVLSYTVKFEVGFIFKLQIRLACFLRTVSKRVQKCGVFCYRRRWNGATENAGMENAGLENVGPNGMAGKGRTGKRGTKFAWVEIAGPENAGPKFQGWKRQDWKMGSET